MIGVGNWNLNAQVAAEFRSGRFFLVGDSAHRFPPTGGLGLHTGVQDAHNIIWKQAFVAAGKASELLLDSYQSERQPIARRNSAHSLTNAMKMVEVDMATGVESRSQVDPAIVMPPPPPPKDHGIDGDGAEATAKRERIMAAIENQRPHFDSMKIEIGFSYAEPAESAGALPDDHKYEPSIERGGLLPHCWIETRDGRISTRDLLDGCALTLVLGPRAGAWTAYTGSLASAGIVLRRDR